MYDAVSEAVPLAQEGQFRKKALVVISDGNDTGSQTTIRELKQQIRESEVLVYAIGIDGESETPTFRRSTPQPPSRPPIPFPFPLPGRGGRRFPLLLGAQGGGGWRITQGDERVNVAALRDMTDDSGGRTEIVRDYRDLDPAVNSIADELSQQYYLGYPSPGYKDGRWHTIRVELRDPNLTVRDVINAVITKTGENIRVKRFARFVLGQDVAPKGTGHTSR